MLGMCLEVSNTKHSSGIHNFWTRVFAGLPTGNAKTLLTLRLFRQELSGILPTCLPAACVSAILRIIWNHADSWGAADDSTWLNPHIFNNCDRLLHVKSIGRSHIFPSHTKRNGLSLHAKKSGLRLLWWAVTLVSLQRNGKHRMGITHCCDCCERQR